MMQTPPIKMQEKGLKKGAPCVGVGYFSYYSTHKIVGICSLFLGLMKGDEVYFNAGVCESCDTVNQ
jgi:hypothetical protein